MYKTRFCRNSPGPRLCPAGVPAAPNRPIAQERSCTSVILRWLPPASTGNCTISGYTVEYREEGGPPVCLLLLVTRAFGAVHHWSPCPPSAAPSCVPQLGTRASAPDCSAFSNLKHPVVVFHNMVTHGGFLSAFTCTSPLSAPRDPVKPAHSTHREAKA